MLRITVILMALVLGACATPPAADTSLVRMASLPQHYTQFDLQLAWETKAVGGHTVVEGVARNVRWAYLYGLEIWVAALDANGKVAARSVSYVIPRQLNLDERAPFTVRLPAALAPGTPLRFTYQYRGSDGCGDDDRRGDGGTSWSQSFESTVPAR